jgi:alpha-tubulin suppressor-like RCC1 family protein
VTAATEIISGRFPSFVLVGETAEGLFILNGDGLTSVEAYDNVTDTWIDLVTTGFFDATLGATLTASGLTNTDGGFDTFRLSITPTQEGGRGFLIRAKITDINTGLPAPDTAEYSVPILLALNEQTQRRPQYSWDLNRTGASSDTFWTQEAPGPWDLIDGNGHAVAIYQGKLYTWGPNGSGQLGQGDTTTRSVPTQVGTDTDWAYAAAGGSFTLAVKTDGTLWSCGTNANGRTGLGTTAGTTTSFTQVGAGTTWSVVDAGTDHAVGVLGGQLYSWGNNANFRTGRNTNSGNTTSPTQINASTGWHAVEAGDLCGFALLNGELWTWGSDALARTGQGVNSSTTSTQVPTQVGVDTNWSALSSNGAAGAALKTDGTLWTWGASGLNGTTSVRLSPTQLTTNSDYTAIGAAGGSGLAVRGTVPNIVVYGHSSALNGVPLLDNTNLASVPNEREVGAVTLVSGASDNLAYAVIDGVPVSWGIYSSAFGRNVRVDSRLLPTIQVASNVELGRWARLSISYAPDTNGVLQTALGIRDGELWTRGDNVNFMSGLGVGSGKNYRWTKVSTLTGWTEVATGNNHAAAIRSGRLYTWGANADGQLGQGDTTTRTTPTQVGTDTDWVAVSAGQFFTVAIKADGTMWSCGSNSAGRTGQGTTSGNTTSFTRIGAATNWVRVFCMRHGGTTGAAAFAINSNGDLWAWGNNSSSVLGDGTTTQRTSPVLIDSGPGWEMVSGHTNQALNPYALGIKSGELYSWGTNAGGRTAQGTTSGSTTTPTRVGAASDWQFVLATNTSAFGIRAGNLLGWGLADGLIGYTTTQTTPVSIDDTQQWLFGAGSGRAVTFVVEDEGPAGPPPQSPPTAPVSEDWPEEHTTGELLFATVTGTDPSAQFDPVYTLEVFDPVNGAWVDGSTPVTYPGQGGLTITQVGLDGSFVEVDTIAGQESTLTVLLRWVAIDSVGVRISAVAEFVTQLLPAGDPPVGLSLTMPTVDEDTTPSTGTARFQTDPEETGIYIWQVSAQLEPPYAGGTSAVLTGQGVTAGTVTVVSQDDEAQAATIRFTPAPNWFGEVTFSYRVSNDLAFSDWEQATVTVRPVPDPPGPVVGEFPNLDEDTTATFDLTWTDPDDLPPGTLAAADGYFLQMRPTAGGPWRWLTEGSPTARLTNVVVRVLNYSNTQLRGTFRIEPDANYYGPYGAQVRVAKQLTEEQGGGYLFGAARNLAGVIGSVPDAPTRPQPNRMPTAKVGQTIAGLFTTFDPDIEDTSWTFEISAPGANTWGSSLVIPDVGTLTVVDDDPADQKTLVRLVQEPGGATDLRYSFDLRVTDSSSLVSPVQRVTGLITLPTATVFLQKVTRNSPAVVTPLTPLVEVFDLNVTDSIDGIGGADVTVSTDEVRRRAAQLGITAAELLEPGTVELVVAIGTQLAFVGPIGEIEWSATRDRITIDARGLLSYLEERRIGTGTTSFVGEDIADIMWMLVDDAQGQSFGDYAFTDNTTTAGTNLTVEFEPRTRILEALRSLSQADGGPDFWIDPERRLNTAAARGQDRRDIIRLTPAMMEAATWTNRDEQLATVVTVIGGEDGMGGFFQGTAVTTDSAALAKYGRRERLIEQRELTSDQQCEDYAARVVAEQARRSETIRLDIIVTPGRPFSIRDLEVGDIVTVDLRAPDLGQVIGAYRVVNRRLNLVSETADSYRVRLDLVPAPFVSSVLVKVKARHNASIVERLAQLNSQQE